MWKSAYVPRMIDCILTFIPMVFILECIWGTIKFFLLVTHFYDHRKEDFTLEYLEIFHVSNTAQYYH